MCEPRFKHDCGQCTYLGPHNDCDLYVCSQIPGIPTVIARFSDEGPDYQSGLASRLPNLREAARRAVELGLLDKSGMIYIGGE